MKAPHHPKAAPHSEQGGGDSGTTQKARGKEEEKHHRPKRGGRHNHSSSTAAYTPKSSTQTHTHTKERRWFCFLFSVWFLERRTVLSSNKNSEKKRNYFLKFLIYRKSTQYMLVFFFLEFLVYCNARTTWNCEITFRRPIGVFLGSPEGSPKVPPGAFT